MSSDRNLDKDPIPSLFFKFYVPALTSLLSVTVHQIVNAVILARQVGKEAVTAVGLFGPVFTVFIALALALMIGSGILLGRHLGARNFDKAQRIFQFTTTIAILFGILMAVVAVPVSRFVSGFLAGSDNHEIQVGLVQCSEYPERRCVRQLVCSGVAFRFQCWIERYLVVAVVYGNSCVDCRGAFYVVQEACLL